MNACPYCGGEGRVVNGVDLQDLVDDECPECEGTGEDSEPAPGACPNRDCCLFAGHTSACVVVDATHERDELAELRAENERLRAALRRAIGALRDVARVDAGRVAEDLMAGSGRE